MIEVRRRPEIDSLRGFAILGVVAVHALYQSKPFSSTLTAIAEQGMYGVQLFYIISAFTIFLSLSHHHSIGSEQVKYFFIRRFFRIAPLFYCAIIFYLINDDFAPHYWVGDTLNATLFNIFLTCIFLNGFNPYLINSIVPGGWSIAVEMMFYAISPYLFSKIKSLRSSVFFTTTTLLISILLSQLGERFILVQNDELWSEFLYLWLPNQIPIFGLGIILFFLRDRLELISPRYRKLISIVILLACLSLWLVFTFSEEFFIPYHFICGILFLGLISALTIYPLKVFVNVYMIFLGKMSYSLYLIHPVFLPLSQKFANYALKRDYLFIEFHFILVFIFTLLGSILISFVTYNIIEIPAQDFGKKYILRLKGYHA
jgi:peptidoglycan/LPS O-acetylase OafA/YrhL